MLQIRKSNRQKEQIQLDLQKTNQIPRLKPLLSHYAGHKMQENNRRKEKTPKTPAQDERGKKKKKAELVICQKTTKKRASKGEKEKGRSKTEDIEEERKVTLSSAMRMRFPGEGGTRERENLSLSHSMLNGGPSPQAAHVLPPRLPLLLFLSPLSLPHRIMEMSFP